MGNCPLKCRNQPASLEPPVAPGDLESNLVVSLEDYPCYSAAAVSMRLGERLSIVSEWLFKGLGRYKAEQLLMQSPNRTGAFIVRESESQQDLYSLSILERPESYRGSVKHYRISRLQNGWFYISQRLTFSSLQNLVLHYTEFASGLCCTLEEPCFILGSDIITSSSSSSSTTQMPVTIRRPSISWKDMSRDLESNVVVSLEDYPCYSAAAVSMRLGERLSIVSE
ncbi:hypothetical protein CRUP_028538 [Coryphaenoides rupestris]|nr:hypothetical protein CRUP_028538 [Coryphaenoides rupestris]